MEGSPDFKIDKRQLQLENGTQEQFPIEFVSRFTKTVTGRLTFRAQRDGGVNAATMVFNLKSMVHSRKAVFTHQIETDSYQQKSVEVEIANDFSLDCAFQLSMTQEVLVNNRWEDACQYIRGGSNKRAKGGKGKARKKPNRKEDWTTEKDTASKSTAVPVNQLSDELKEAAFPAPFYCNRSTVKVKANSTSNITVDFLPLKPGTYRCQLILLDERVGETMYEVIGKAGIPNQFSRFPVTIEMSELCTEAFVHSI